ncbi:MAG TPA: cupin domain-containing protein [Galbitalea sp.]|jgi:quercetin dioxygenase-like cupin family protein|nr:cupin domain-containing protein [Galbitalea sp.]
MSAPTKQSFAQPDSTMDMMEKITVDVVNVHGTTLQRVTTDPGWIWSVHSRPLQKTDSCQVDHVLYMISGKVAAKDDDGNEVDYVAGDLAHIPPGHDGWTVGDEPAVWIEVPH